MAIQRTLFGDDSAVIGERDFQALLLANLLGPLGSTLLSPILETLVEPFGSSPAEIGLLVSVFSAPAIVVIPIAGMLADRYGRKPVLIVAILLYGAAGTAIATTTDFRVVLGLRFLQGVAYGGLTPIIITAIGDLYAGTEETTAQGIRFTTSGLSQATFPFISGVLVVAAWQYPFLLYAMSFPIAAAVFRWFEEPTELDEPGSVGDDGGHLHDLRALAALVANRRVFAIVLARGFPVIVWIGFITYNSFVVDQNLGGTPAQAGLLAAAGSLVFAVAASQAGRISSMFGSLLYPLVTANVFLGVGFATFLMARSVVVAGVGISITGIGFGLTMSIYRSLITGFATDALRGGLVSLSESFGRTCLTLTPLLMGWVIAAASPEIGIGGAIRLAGLGAAAVATTGGVVCLVVAAVSPPVPDRSPEGRTVR